jgi:hypothetical protein
MLKRILQLVYITRTDFVSTTQVTALMAVREIVVAYFENNMKYI